MVSVTLAAISVVCAFVVGMFVAFALAIRVWARMTCTYDKMIERNPRLRRIVVEIDAVTRTRGMIREGMSPRAAMDVLSEYEVSLQREADDYSDDFANEFWRGDR